jgi:hypothetical protein
MNLKTLFDYFATGTTTISINKQQSTIAFESMETTGFGQRLGYGSKRLFTCTRNNCQIYIVHKQLDNEFSGIAGRWVRK